MTELIGKVVEVGTAETIYTGRLVEINEDDVYLEADAGWIVVPVEKIAFIREKEEELSPFLKTFHGIEHRCRHYEERRDDNPVRQSQSLLERQPVHVRGSVELFDEGVEGRKE